MNKKNFEIVVARYNENNIKWIEKYKNYVTIYNKGGSFDNNLNLNDIEIVSLQNIGNEAHTYFYHIVNNYYNLSDYTCFVQADPIPHIQFTQSTDIFSEMLENTKKFYNFYWISETIGTTNIINNRHAMFAYKQFFGEEPDNTIISFGQGSQFAVSKELIQKRPFTFYKNILSIFEYTLTPYDLFMELFWGHVFNV